MKGSGGMSFETIRANEVIYYIGRRMFNYRFEGKEEYLKGHIPSAINIPYENLENEINRLNRNKLLILL